MNEKIAPNIPNPNIPKIFTTEELENATKDGEIIDYMDLYTGEGVKVHFRNNAPHRGETHLDPQEEISPEGWEAMKKVYGQTP